MPATIFSGSKVKALKDRLSLNDATEILSVNADPSSGAGVAAPLGSIAMDYLAGKVYKKTGSANTEWQELGAGLGGINYIKNPDAESGVTGWTVYNETDAVTFADATDRITLTDHGLQNGQMVMFRSLTAGAGISALVKLYVVNADTNTFQVATSVGGSPLTININGSGIITRDRPKLGTGGTPNFQWTRDTNAPLRGVADFNLKKYPSSGSPLGSLGQGVSYDFTIDRADQGKVLTVTFDYEWIQQSAGGISGIDITDSNLTVYIVQDPTGTPVVIQPAGYQVQLASLGTKVRQVATFQTASNVLNYRLCLHAANVTSFLDELAIDNVSVGPQVVQYGAPVTDWVEYTPNWTGTGWGTPSNVDIYWRRVGDNMQIRGTFRIVSPTAAEASIRLPAGYSIDTNKISALTQKQIVGYGKNIVTSATISDNYNIPLQFDGTTLDRVFTAGRSQSGNLLKLNVNSDFVTNDAYTFFFEVPILGWSSTVQMSNDTDTRVVAARYTVTSGTVSDNVVIGSAKSIDTHNAYNTSTGLYTVPVSGLYRVGGTIYTAAVNLGTTQGLTIKAHKNTTFYSQMATTKGAGVSTGYAVAGSTLVSCVAGDTIAVHVASSVATTITNTVDSQIFFERLSGPSAIAASETVAANYWLPANQSAGAATPINFSSKQYDTHGAVTTGANWRFTAPIAGKYSVTTQTFVSGAATRADLYKNSGANRYVMIGDVASGNTCVGTVVVDLLAGDYFDIRPAVTQTILGGTFDSASGAKIWITRVGN